MPPEDNRTFEEQLLEALLKPLPKMYLVGGAVREIVRGHAEKVKDWDFAVEAEGFWDMRLFIQSMGFEIFLETPQYFTLRARAPKDKFEFAGLDMTHKTFDFTLCRTEGEYTDGRRPDNVTRGTILEDLSRRDFTMNAMALDSAGGLIDPYNGKRDIKDQLIRCVGEAKDRFTEDSLRMLRAIRFSIQLGFEWDHHIERFLKHKPNADLLDNISKERVRDELFKCFKANTLRTLEELEDNWAIREKIFDGSMWLEPTFKGL